MKRIILLLLLMLFLYACSMSQPQWRPIGGTANFDVVAIDIYRRSPDTLYAMGRGLLISTNRGEHWDTLSNAIGAPLGALKVDPTDWTRLYASYATPGGNNIGISSDGGRKWKEVFRGMIYPVPVVEIDPMDHKTVYAGVGPGFLDRTTNGGQTWDTLYNFYVEGLNSMAIAPSNDSILYFASYGQVYKSTDRAATLQQHVIGDSVWGWTQLAVHPHNPNIVYASVFSWNGTFPGGVYKSTDGGTNWHPMNNGLSPTDWQIPVIVINPKRPEELFVGAGSVQNRILFRSTDGAESWSPFNSGLPDSGHVAAIAIDTMHNRIYIGVTTWNAGGIYIWDNTENAANPIDPLPREFRLEQNYPNPFNPSTEIRLQITAL